LADDDARAIVEAYVHGGPADGATVRANVEAWERIALRPRVLRDVTDVDLGIELFGLTSPVPVIAAPWAGHGLLHPDGEIATARGLRVARIPLVQSSGSSAAIGDVAVHSGPFWQQVYVPADRGLIDGFLARAIAAGATAMVLTVDHPAIGNTLPFRSALGRVLDRSAHRWPGNFADVPEGADLGTAPDLGPADIEALARRTGLPVIVKGILRADDARIAVDAGAAAVIVSNHGGRQLAGSITTAAALPEVVAAIDSAVPVLVDGGIRRGEDVVRALALGAAAVLVGRPIAAALGGAAGGVGGAEGVARWARETVDDVRRSFVLCGAPTIASVSTDLVRVPGGTP
jgi:4-hydroxymandelate oxidase